MDRKAFQQIRYDNIDHFSISGVQDKISLKLMKRQLIPTEEAGEYILKPIPQIDIPRLQNDITANEHLTMQIAQQIFKIPTAGNALIPFSDGELAYITKRFDRNKNQKRHQEDFCQLMGKSPELEGDNYKYTGSYQEAAKVVKKFSAAYLIELERFFSLILFNYLIGNGDAHLKNFSLLETDSGDFVLSPAYDLINTSLHFPNESRMALDLFNDYESNFFKINGFYGKEDFVIFAKDIGIKDNRTINLIDRFLNNEDRMIDLVNISFLSNEAKVGYIEIIRDRLKAVRIS